MLYTVSRFMQQLYIAVFFWIILLGSSALHAATFTVTNTADSGAGSLRAAIIASNFLGGSNTIVFTIPANSTITVASGLPSIIANVTIDGAGASGLTLSGGNTSNIFSISTVGALVGPTVEIKNLTLANAKASGEAGGTGAARSGGGGGSMGAGGGLLVLDNANVTITNVNFSSNNVTGGSGGAGGINAIAAGTGGNGGGNGLVLGGVGGLSGVAGLPGLPGVFGTGGGGGGGGLVGVAGLGGAGVLGGGSGGSGSGILSILPGTISPGYGGSGGGGVVNGGGGGGGGGGALGGAVFVAATSTISFANVSMNGNTAIGGAGGLGTSGGGNGNAGQAAGAGLFLTAGGTFKGGTYSDQISGVGPAIIASGTNTFSGINNYLGDTLLSGGTLQVSSDAALGNVLSDIVFNGGVLKTTAGITTSREIGWTTNGGSIDTNGQNSTFAGVMSGLGGLTKTGDGVLTLSAFNLYLGQTAINGGTIAITSMLNIGMSTSIGMNNGTLRTDATANIGQSIVLGAGGGTINTNGNNSFLIGGIIGVGDFTKDGAGTLTVSGLNTYSGQTKVLDGMLVAAITNAFNTSKQLWIDSDAGFNTGGFNQTFGSLAGGGNVANALTTLTVGNDNTDTTYSGVMSGVGGRLVKNGTGTMTLSGANTYSGGTKVDTGILSVSSAGNLGSGNVELDGATLQLTANAAISQNVVLSGGGTIDTDSNNVGVSGVISGNGGLTKSGTGMLELSGTNTYTGGTNVTGGILKINSAANLGSGAVNLSNSGVLLGGNATLAQAFAVSNGAGLDDGGNIGTLTSGVSGTGGFTKAGAGTLTLANNNTFSGALNVNEGTLVVSGTNAYAGGTNVTGGATLQAASNSNLGSGGIALNNGKLDLTGATTVTQNMVVNNVGTVDTNANVDTLSGVISGAGKLAKDGAGTLNLTGTNTYTGGTQVLDGIVRIANASNVGSGTVTLDDAELQFVNPTNLANAFALNNGGTVNTGGNDQILRGNISGNGGLTKTGSGMLALLGTNTYTGGTEIVDGTLTMVNARGIGSGTLRLDNSTLRPAADFTLNNAVDLVGGGIMDTNGRSNTLAGVISGNGGLTKIGSGTLTLAAANTYTGVTDVTNGTLNMANAQLNSDVVVAPISALTGNGTINGALDNSGLLAPRAGRSLNVSGNYTQNSGATLLMNINPTSAPQLNVGGTASLSGKLGVNFMPGTYIAAIYKLIHSNQISGGFNDTTVLNTPVGFRREILQDGGDISIKLSVPTPTNIDVLPDLAELSINEAHEVNHMLMDCLENSRGGSSCAPKSQNNDTVMRRLSYMGDTPIVRGIVTNLPDVMARYGGWFRAYGSMGSMGSYERDPGYDNTSGGFMAGIDKKMTRNISLGIAAGYGHTIVTQRNTPDTTSTLDAPRAMIYGSYHAGDNVYWDGNIGYAHNGISSNRDVAATGQVAVADYVTHEASMGLQVSKAYKSGSFQLVPKAGMSFAHLMQDAYTETGATGFNMSVEQQTTDTLRPYIGASILTNLRGNNGGITTPSLHFKYSREVLDVTTNRNANVLGTNFLVEGTKPPKNIFSLGSGVTSKLDQNLDLFFEYNADVYTDYGTGIKHTIAAGFRKMF